MSLVNESKKGALSIVWLQVIYNHCVLTVSVWAFLLQDIDICHFSMDFHLKHTINSTRIGGLQKILENLANKTKNKGLYIQVWL